MVDSTSPITGTSDPKIVSELFQGCFNIPKIELHAHLSGCIRPTTFMNMAMEKGIDLDDIDFYNINIESAFKVFTAISKIVTTPQIVFQITKEMIEDFAK